MDGYYNQNEPNPQLNERMHRPDHVDESGLDFCGPFSFVPHLSRD